MLQTDPIISVSASSFDFTLLVGTERDRGIAFHGKEDKEERMPTVAPFPLHMVGNERPRWRK